MGREPLHPITAEQTSSSLIRGGKAEAVYTVSVLNNPRRPIMDANGITWPTIIRKNLNITWLFVCGQQMHSLLFHIFVKATRRDVLELY